MTVIHEFEVTATCPVDPSITDIYATTLRTDTMIAVEELLALARTYEHEAIYQEALTADMRENIGHGELTTVGIHSGVKVTVVVGEYPCSI